MTIQIDRLETNVEITAPTAAPRPGAERPQAPPEDPATSSVLRDAIGDIFADEIGLFRRMRGH